MSTESKNLGKKGEQLAVIYLKGKNYKIIATNYRYGKGEIDIIAEDPYEDSWVFVEVKTRESIEYGAPEFSITPGKIKQIKKVAELYLYDKGIREHNCRFDVIAIVLNRGREPDVTHYINAFM